MFEIYGFCRAVDDVADGGGGRQVRLAELAGWRMDIDALFAEAAPSRVRALAGPIRAFDLQREDFLSIIDGMEMDVRSDIRAPELATLDLYCERVACAVGRLSPSACSVYTDRTGQRFLFTLGRALQLTNILRDLDEDAGKGRLYLPREALLAAGIDQTDPATVLDHPALSKACATVLERARDNFTDAGLLMAKRPLSIVRAPRLMAEVYRNILERVAARRDGRRHGAGSRGAGHAVGPAAAWTAQVNLGGKYDRLCSLHRVRRGLMLGPDSVLRQVCSGPC